MSETKTIQYIAPQKTRKRSQQKNKKLLPFHSFQTQLKKRLLENKNNEIRLGTTESRSTSESRSLPTSESTPFQEALTFLNEVSKKNKHKELQHIPPPSISFTPHPPLPVSSNSTAYTYSLDSEVPHGCLRNGIKPTWKQWKQNEPTPIPIPTPTTPTPTPTTPIPTTPIPTPTTPIPTPTQTPTPIQTQTSTPTPIQTTSSIMPVEEYNWKKITKKYILGKSEETRKVGVLIKNRQTRKNVQLRLEQIKQTPIFEQKKYLKKHGIIKVGSVAPNNLIRQLFENAVSAGEIKNLNSKTLLDSFMNHEEP